MGWLLKLVQVLLDGIPSFICVNPTNQLGVICKLVEDALDPLAYVTVKNHETVLVPTWNPEGHHLFVTDTHQDIESLTTVLWMVP